MEWLKGLEAVAGLPLQVLLLAVVVILWRKIEALQAENKELMERLIDSSEENVHISTDNKARLKRLEREELGTEYPTIPRNPPLT